MDIWKRFPLEQNPYYWNAFRVTRVPREVIRRKTMGQLIDQTRRVIKTDPQAHTILGEPVSNAKLIAAEQILLNPTQRILEELLEHAVEKPPLEHIRLLAGEIERYFSSDSQPTGGTVSMEWLRPWAFGLLKQVLTEASTPDPSFGALELALIPPFGQVEED